VAGNDVALTGPSPRTSRPPRRASCGSR
jgi:hypothetical protein